MRSGLGEIVAVAVVAAALVALGVAFGSAGPSQEDARPSSFIDSRSGLRGLYLVLEEIGAKPRRSQAAPAAAEPKDHTLVVASPTQPFTRRETAEVVAWVRGGGRLVVVAGPAVPVMQPFADTLLKPFGLSMQLTQYAAGHDFHFADATLEEGLGLIDWPAVWSVAAAPGATPKDAAAPQEVITKNGKALAMRETFGAGEVLAIADVRLLDNDSLPHSDNAVLAVRLLLARNSDGGNVVFDEFHHGFQAGGATGDAIGAMASMLVHTWPGRAVLMLLLAGLVAICGAAVRFGAPEHEKPPPRRALTEHAEALGRLFETARARREALQILAAGARRVIGARTGIPAALPPAEFTQRLASSPAPGAGELAEAMENAQIAESVGDSDLADAARELAAAKWRFLHGGD